MIKLIIFIIFIVNVTQTIQFKTDYKEQQTTTQILNETTFSNSTPIDRRLHLEQNLGPQKRQLSFVLSMSTLYILILICGLFGNISTCCVIVFNSCMHTTTNYYLFSLAVSDVLSLLIGLPIELTELFNGSYPWIFGDLFCKVRIYIFETTTIASVLTILTFTCERWLHICKSFYAKKFSDGFSRALKIILFIWGLSGFLALPYAFTSGVFIQMEGYPESELCGSLKKHNKLMGNFLISYAFLFFIIPMTMISIMYVLIGIKLWHSQNKFQQQNTDSINGKKKFKTKIRKMINKTNNSENIGLNDSIVVEQQQNNNSKFKHLSKQFSEMSVNETHSINEKTSKDFEKARQSRRDVVKMLCNYFCFFCLNFKLIEMFCY